MNRQATPILPGVYWLEGSYTFGDWTYTEPLYVEFDGKIVSLFGDECSYRLDEFDGIWYGPIQPPTSAAPDDAEA